MGGPSGDPPIRLWDNGRAVPTTIDLPMRGRSGKPSALLLALLLIAWGCSANPRSSGLPAGSAPGSTLVTDGYVAAEVCAGCHAAIASSYRSVAMARSFGRLDAATLVEDFGRGNRFVHRPSGFTYEMRREGGRFLERRSERDAAGREARVFDREITYVVGSGRHARTYLNRGPDGGITELPVSWYAREKGWGMSPGYDRKDQPDFFRAVTYRCLFCHNGYPAVPAGADLETGLALFPEDLPSGIDCQRCHGPGARHVALARDKRSGFAEVRGSIVNPARLPPARQMDICMQCHLETTSDANVSALLIFGRGIYSFRPGEALAAYRIHFDTAPGGGLDDKFEIAHQAYRLRQSACFRGSAGKMTCTTCHDPHRRPEAPAAFFSAKCLACHAPSALPPGSPHHPGADCVSCHMPARRTDDVVHVVMTDHRIGLYPGKEQLVAPKSERPESYKGAVVFYRQEEAPAGALKDLYLSVASVQDEADPARWVAVLDRAIAGTEPRHPEPYLQLGASLLNLGRSVEAVEALRKAADLAPGNARIRMALGNALGAAGRAEAALKSYDEALALWPAYSEAQTNAGNLLFQTGHLQEALSRYDRAIEARADNTEAHSNRGAVLIRLGRIDEAIAALDEALRIDPRHAGSFNNLAAALKERGDEGRLLEVLREGHAKNPGHAGLMTRLAYLLATSPEERRRNGVEARSLAEEAVRLTRRRDAAALDALGAALAETGAAAEALRVAAEARGLAQAGGNPELAAAIGKRLGEYERGRPYREPPVRTEGRR
jgi:tetratricopeptide (TPR) repeat protein